MNWKATTILCLATAGLLFPLVLSNAAGKSQSNQKAPVKKSQPAEVKKPIVQPKDSPKAVLPIEIKLEEKGGQVILKASRATEVEVWIGKKLVQKCAKGKECKVTEAVRKAGEGSLVFVCRELGRKTCNKTFSTAGYQHLFQPDGEKPEAPGLPQADNNSMLRIRQATDNQRLERKLGENHPRVKKLKAGIEKNPELVRGLKVQMEVDKIKVPESDPGGSFGRRALQVKGKGTELMPAESDGNSQLKRILDSVRAYKERARTKISEAHRKIGAARDSIDDCRTSTRRDDSLSIDGGDWAGRGVETSGNDDSHEGSIALASKTMELTPPSLPSFMVPSCVLIFGEKFCAQYCDCHIENAENELSAAHAYYECLEKALEEIERIIEHVAYRCDGEFPLTDSDWARLRNILARLGEFTERHRDGYDPYIADIERHMENYIECKEDEPLPLRAPSR